MDTGDTFAELAAPFDPLSEWEASALLGEHWGLHAQRLTRLDTERDDTFRVELARGERRVLKVAHPLDAEQLIAFQCALLEHLAHADPLLPTPRVVPTLAGEPFIRHSGRLARVLGWQPGVPIGDAARSETQLRNAGRIAGRVVTALAGFTHPGAHRVLIWDLARVPQLAGISGDAELDDHIARFAAEVAPLLAELPRQVVHHDLHIGNVLVDVNDPTQITGVIDVGDAVHSLRVAELAVALAYLVPAEGTITEAFTPYRLGFEEQVALTDAERAALPELVIARQLQRIVINGELDRAAIGHVPDMSQARATLRRLVASRDELRTASGL